MDQKQIDQARDKLRAVFLPIELILSNKTWLEDVDHENGKYVNNCAVCQFEFIGHKRRAFCRECS